MKTIMKKTAVLFLAVLMLFGSLLIPAEQTKGQVTAPSGYTHYYYGYKYTYQFDVSGFGRANALDVNSVKSSNSKVAAVNKYLIRQHAADTNSDSVTIFYTVKKAGKAVISYKLGDTVYKTTITVKKASSSGSSKYVCPVKSLTITGVNNNKNIAGKLKKTGYVSYLKCKATEDSLLKVTAKPGWVMNSYCYLSNTNGLHDRYYDVKSAETATVELGELEKTAQYLSISFRNSGTGATAYLTIYFK